jgi:hypothetical protein
MPTLKSIRVASLFLICFASGAFAADEPCIANYTVNGSFLKGREFTTWQKFSDVTRPVAYQRIYAGLVKYGWKIGQTDKEMGVVSASQEVAFGQGKSSQFNVLIEEENGGIKVTETFTTSGGLIATEKNVQTMFCNGMNAIAGK